MQTHFLPLHTEFQVPPFNCRTLTLSLPPQLPPDLYIYLHSPQDKSIWQVQLTLWRGNIIFNPYQTCQHLLRVVHCAHNSLRIYMYLCTYLYFFINVTCWACLVDDLRDERAKERKCIKREHEGMPGSFDHTTLYMDMNVKMWLHWTQHMQAHTHRACEWKCSRNYMDMNTKQRWTEHRARYVHSWQRT